MIPKECKWLAEVDLPIAAVSKHSAQEKSIHYGDPSTLHLWWPRRPRADLYPEVVFAGVQSAAGRAQLQITWDVWNKGRAMAMGVVLEVRVRSFWPGLNERVSVNPSKFCLGVERGANQLPDPQKSSQADYCLVENYTPITGKPIRSEDGHVAFLRMQLDWGRLKERVSVTNGEGTLEFDWVVGAQDMRPRRGRIVGHLNGTSVACLSRRLFENHEVIRRNGLPDITVDIRFTEPS